MPNKPLLAITIYQQECHGEEQWRVMRDDGRRFMEALQVDFDSERNAVACTWSELRRYYSDYRWQVRISRNYTISGGHLYETLANPYEANACDK